MKEKRKRFRKPAKLENLIFLTTFGLLAFVVGLISIISSFYYNSNILDVARLSSNNIANQISTNYKNYAGKIINEFLYVENETLEYSTSSPTKNIFKTMVDSREDLYSIDFIDYKNKTYIVSYPEKTSNVDDEFISKVINDNTSYYFSKPYYDSSRKAYYIKVGKSVTYLDTDDNQWKEGVLSFSYNFQQIIDIANISTSCAVFFINDNNDFIYSNNDKYKDFALEAANEIVLGNDEKESEGEHFFAKVDTVNYTKWRLILLNNISEYYTYINDFFSIIIGVSVGSLLISFVISNFVARQILKPLKEISHTIKNVRSGDMNARVDISKVMRQRLAVTLGVSLNEMLTQIQSLMNQIVLEQEVSRIAEVKALQNQINPHFLYNTLNSIEYLAETGQNKDVVLMVDSLAKFFRISISKGKQIITIKEEIQHVESYLIIQKIRYKDAFTYEFDIEEGLEEYKCMKLILQPFVENCINHGLKGMVDEGKILIKVFSQDNHVVFEIIDNGLGIDEVKVKELNESIKDRTSFKGVGMKNVYQRLIIFYKNDADIVISSIQDQGTTIKVIIPKTLEENDALLDQITVKEDNKNETI